jgi:hypothetical protein
VIMLYALSNGVAGIPDLCEQVSLIPRRLSVEDRIERSRLVSHPYFSVIMKCLISLLIKRAVLETVIDDICAMDDDPVRPCTVISR